MNSFKGKGNPECQSCWLHHNTVSDGDDTTDYLLLMIKHFMGHRHIKS